MSVNKTYLPEPKSQEAKALVRQYKSATTEQLDVLAGFYGYKHRNTFLGAMRKVYGVKMGNNINKPPPNPPPKPPEPEIKIPPIKINKYQSRTGKKPDPETQVLFIGDWHEGEITPTYNPKVAEKRIDTLFNSTMIVNEVHRKSMPIDDLVIICLGDMVHGENPYQGAKIESVDSGAVNQIYELALPHLLSLVCSFRENFKTVKLYGVWGNHGRCSRESPHTSNWDNALYKTLLKAKKPDGIEVYPPTDFYQMVNVQGFKFFCYHGDQVKVYNGIPYFAQRRKLMSWYITYGGFTYAVQGHIHEDNIFSVSARTTLFCNGSLVSDDPFALETMGVSTIPVQRTCGVHHKYGVTWTNRIYPDLNFLPHED